MAAGSSSDCVKVRPLLGIELAKGDNESVISYPLGDSVPQLQVGNDKNFSFDHVFNERSQQKQVYNDAIKPLVGQFLNGYNATVIAYGQTGSGKTYTMGTLGCDDAKLQEEWGVIPSAIHDIFNTLKNKGDDENDYKVQCSFIEIYNEEIKDLLDPNSSKTLAIRENSGGPSKIHIPNMKLEVVRNAMEMAEALDSGGACRATASTQMNSQSSRSHAIFTIHLHHIKATKPSSANSDSNNSSDKNVYSEPTVIQSKFHFVDLAGSERAKKTGATGTRMAEGISINAGLLALGNVIAALGDARLKAKHVPFRDSKITRLLQDSLGGNSKTLMIACVSPARSNMLETKNTLNYANRAKNIKNKAVVNRDPRSRQILQLRQRVKELEQQLCSNGLGLHAFGGGGNNGQQGFDSNKILVKNEEYEQQIEQITQLRQDLNDSNNEVLKLQEKVKNLRLNLSELQDKYYSEIGSAKTNVAMEQRKRQCLIEKIKEKYPNFDISIASLSDAEEKNIRSQIEIMERLKLENESLKKENGNLHKTIIRNESQEQNLIHNLQDRMAKVIRGDFSMLQEDNLLSPSKRFEVSSSTDSIPELVVMSEGPSSDKNVILLDNTDGEDDDDSNDDEDDDFEEEPDEEVEDDGDVSMVDPKKQKIKEANSEREKLKKEKKLSMIHKKKLIKEQKVHSQQMEFIANEQLSRERSQRLKSEKFNREIDRTNRDIYNIQTMLKQLCQQRQSDCSKKQFYEKQVTELAQELEEAHKVGRVYEAEKAKLNPNDAKKLQAQEIKIGNYRNKVQSLTLQIRSYKEKLGQIRKLQAMHKEDMLKMTQMTRKLSDLKRKKVDLQKKLTAENKGYAKWKQQSDKTIKQLRKIQREKTIQISRQKSQLNKTASALKQKTAALCNLRKKQKESQRKVSNNRRNTSYHRGRGRGNAKANVKQIKQKIAKLLSSLIGKHQLFYKYKQFDRDYKSMQHELKDYQQGMSECAKVMSQIDRDCEEEEEEFSRLNAEKLEYEQRIEDTQSTIKYIRESMIEMSYKMKESDHKRWKQLQNAQKVNLSCAESDLDKFLTVSNIPYARSCINFLVNQHLKYRLIMDDYKKTTQQLKGEKAKIISTADNELRKKMVLIEKLQSQLQEERTKHRFQQIKSATDTIDEDAEDDDDGTRNVSFQDDDDERSGGSNDMMHIDNNESDNDNDDDDDLEYHKNTKHQNAMRQSPIPMETELKSKQAELNRSKKLLNMYCSPRHSRTQAHTQNNVNSSSSVSMLSLRNNLNVKDGGNPITTPVINRKLNERISVQLTPFHTPNVQSKVRSSRLFGSNNGSSNHPSIVNSEKANNENMQISESPLMQQSKSENNLNAHHVMPVVNKPIKRNVFSRLTNPKHFTATSRTRAQELQALKHKIRKQKDSHNQIQQKRHDWFAQKSENQNDQNADDLMEDEHHNHNHNHSKPNPSVFRRLHKTQIRNTRPNLNSSMNSNGDDDAHMDHNDSGLLIEPSRVVNQQEIGKKAQRNMIHSKSMLMAPVRVMTPDDDEL